MSNEFDRSFLEFAADADAAPVAESQETASDVAVDEPTDEPALDLAKPLTNDAEPAASEPAPRDDAALLREQLEQERQARQKWEAAARSDAARVAALQRKYEAQAQKQQAAPPPVSAAPRADLPLQSLSPDALAHLQTDFPELADALATLTKANEATVLAQAEQIQQLHEAVAPLQEQQQVAYLASQYEALNAAHPDWQQVVNTGEFNQWLQQQPVAVHSILSSDSAADSAWLLSQFKQSVQAQTTAQQMAALQSRQATRTKKLSDAVGVSSRVAPSADTGAPSDFESAFRFYAQR